MEIPDAAVEAAAKTLLNEGAAPGHNIHTWRCEDPGRYGECDCVEVTARAALVAARPYLMPPREALVSTFMDFRERNGGCPDGPDCEDCRDIAGDEADAVLALLNGTKS